MLDRLIALIRCPIERLFPPDAPLLYLPERP